MHANSALSALYRLEQLVQETTTRIPKRLIAEAIDMIVFISGRGQARRVDTIAHVTGLDERGVYAVTEMTTVSEPGRTPAPDPAPASIPTSTPVPAPIPPSYVKETPHV